MDFMKVIDQTVREIKREVNLKVLKVPEIEQKVLDATDDEPWGPHGSALAEIAHATKKFSELQMVMNVLWTRLSETGKNWRYVYKALAVIEYLVASGSEHAVDDIIEHTFQISSLASFEYVESNGKDMGINVRKKAETIVALLNDKDKIQEVRNKAAANREKYFGLSSSGITYKLGSASYGGSNFQNCDRYGGFNKGKDSDTFKDSYKDNHRFGEEKFGTSSSTKAHRKTSKESAQYGSKGEDTSASGASRPKAADKDSDKYATVPSQNSIANSNNDDGNDFDDFDPRGTSTTQSAVGNSNQVDLDLFGQSLVCDLMDAPAPFPREASTVISSLSEVDMFSDATFVSAPPRVEAVGNSETQATVDLFASQPASSPPVSSSLDLFAIANPIVQPDKTSSKFKPINTNEVDLFAAVPLNSFDGSDLFGAFTSNIDPSSSEAIKNPRDLNGKSSAEPKKDKFQVKSGIWADSLTRGLIDLNISAPKKESLPDIGIAGGLSDGAGSGVGRSSGFTSWTIARGDELSKLGSQQYHLDGFK